MKKKILSRVIFGMPIGLGIGYVITIVISLCAGGDYLPCMPQLTADLGGNEAAAVTLQAVLCALLGEVFAGCSAIWESDMSLFKQTAVYFGITCPVMMVIAYVLHWMKHSWTGFAIYLGIFLGIFVSIWLAQYFAALALVKKANAKLENK